MNKFDRLLIELNSDGFEANKYSENWKENDFGKRYLPKAILPVGIEMLEYIPQSEKVRIQVTERIFSDPKIGICLDSLNEFEEKLSEIGFRNNSAILNASVMSLEIRTDFVTKNVDRYLKALSKCFHKDYQLDLHKYRGYGQAETIYFKQIRKGKVQKPKYTQELIIYDKSLSEMERTGEIEQDRRLRVGLTLRSSRKLKTHFGTNKFLELLKTKINPKLKIFNEITKGFLQMELATFDTLEDKDAIYYGFANYLLTQTKNNLDKSINLLNQKVKKKMYSKEIEPYLVSVHNSKHDNKELSEDQELISELLTKLN
jgi:hypothetical protein